MAQLKTYTCQICGHSWHPRKPGLPKVCPNCHNERWNDPEGRKRPPLKIQKANAARRRIKQAVETLHIPITKEMEQQAMSKYEFVKPHNERLNVGTSNAGPWNEQLPEQDRRTDLFNLMDWDDERDEMWRVNDQGEGECLTGDDIYPGDSIHFRFGLQPENGDIVLAIGHDVDGRMFSTIKHYYEIRQRNGEVVVELRSSNPDCPNISAFKFNVEVKAVAQSVIRRSLRNRRPNSKIQKSKAIRARTQITSARESLTKGKK